MQDTTAVQLKPTEIGATLTAILLTIGFVINGQYATGAVVFLMFVVGFIGGACYAERTTKELLRGVPPEDI